MTSKTDARLAELGITLPSPAAPAANYVPTVRTGNLLYVSGQVSMGSDGPEFVGKLGREFGVEEGRQAARLCAINIVAHARTALGDLDKVVRVVKLNGFVNCTPDFTDPPKVVNGASDLLVELFGERGRHARAAVGVASLPLGCAVEVEAILEVA